MTTSFDAREAACVIGTCSDVVRGAHALIDGIDLVDSVPPDVAALVSYALRHVSVDLDAIEGDLRRAARP